MRHAPTGCADCTSMHMTAIVCRSTGAPLSPGRGKEGVKRGLVGAEDELRVLRQVGRREVGARLAPAALRDQILDVVHLRMQD